ncbi:MAG: M36 family metallopeptidase [Acidobacteriota bacterium]|nr:M36 family metallopeptidase [Acidobacteriota bacterium]
MHGEPRLGVPTFVWGSQGLSKLPANFKRSVKPNKAEAAAAAKAHAANLASNYDLNQADIDNATVRFTHDTGNGPIVTKMQQSINGIEIFREEMNVVMNRNLDLVAVTGYISSKNTKGNAHAGGALNFRTATTDAAATALGDVTGSSVTAAQLVASTTRDGYDYYTVANGTSIVLDEPVRAKKVYFHTADGIEPGYYVEVAVRDAEFANGLVPVGASTVSYYSYVVSAIDGEILFRNNLTAHESATTPSTPSLGDPGLPQYTFRVWADPVTGIPYDTPEGNDIHPKLNPVPDGLQDAFLAPNDVTLSSFPFSKNDPWLAPGATVTTGNNADAYVDLTSPDGFGPAATAAYGGAPVCASPAVGSATCGDFRASTTSANAFQNTFNTSLAANASAAQRQAAIQQLFYDVNFLHDWFYDHGFDEAAGNAQTNNFGRGGLGNDSIKAEAQDVGGTDNANMSTPSDGSRPRMQMYVFTANGKKFAQVMSPANIAGQYNTGTSLSGPQAFDRTANVVRGVFNAGLCTFSNAAQMSGKIVMVDYGTGSCFGPDMDNAAAAGATGYILVWQSSNPNQVANYTANRASITNNNIAWASISWNTGLLIKNELTNNVTVSLRMLREAAITRDGTIDNQIVFHEWGHYISNRLISNSNGLASNMAGSLGEGWGDFNAMLLTVRAEDINIASNPNWAGVYTLATYATGGTGSTWSPNGNGAYFGIRRYPYSTDLTKNPLTYGMIANGVALPAGIPISFGQSGTNNSEVHASGEVWTAMLWECYAALLRDTQGASPRLTFQQAQDRMKSYYVASLKMTPANPTFLEARDAVLAAAYATDYTDFVLFQQAFAKRGAGTQALSPDRFSLTHAGAVESYVSAPDVTVSASSLDDSVLSCDNDGILDSGDRGRLTLTIKNIGTAPLSGTTGTISSSSAGVTFPNGNTINFGGTDVLGSASGNVIVALASGIGGIQQLDFTVSLADAALSAPRSAAVSFRANAASSPATSITDAVETNDTVWAVSSSPSPVAPFARKYTTTMNRVWHVDNGTTKSDERLTSPAFTVGAGGSITLEFDHSWSFEFSSTGNWDGGVVEKSLDGGTTWTDVALTGTNAYNGNLLAPSQGNDNPLAVGSTTAAPRKAFVRVQSSTVHTVLTMTATAGASVMFRFREGSDSGSAYGGWDIDNIKITGINETPFSTLVGDAGCAVAAATTTTVSATPNPSTFGSTVTINANVNSTGAQVNGGTVTFKDGATTIGSGTVSAGVASMTISTLTAGAHSLTAVYGGNASFLTSTSSSYALTINKAASSVALISSQNPSTPGQSVTFTATVSSTAGTPNGSVTFSEGATTLGSAALTSGVATYTTSSLSGGAHTITASYVGNATIAGSSNSLTQNVNTGSVVNFAQTALFTMENAANVTLTVTRTGGDTSGPATVSFTTTNGTAIAGVRYNAVSMTVNFAGGETSKDVIVPLINTIAVEGKQTFNAALSSPNAAALGVSYTATVTIMDDDAVNSDFSATSDGKRDILWRNNTTGDTRAWLMNNNTMLSSISIPGYGTDWNLAGVADFNGDGHADVLWRNKNDFSMKVSYMKNTDLVQSTGTIDTVADANWQVVGVADMNADGFPDIIWRNTSTFASNVWMMRDTTRLSIVSLQAVADANWSIVGFGDFNRDRKTDIVWRYAPTAKMTIWLMNGTTFVSSVALPTVGAPWIPAGVGDMNGDGDADLLWMTTTSPRSMTVWNMNQTSFVTSTSINTAGDTTTANDLNFKVVAPK